MNTLHTVVTDNATGEIFVCVGGGLYTPAANYRAGLVGSTRLARDFDEGITEVARLTRDEIVARF